MFLVTPVLLLLLPWISLQAVAEVCRGTHCFGADTGDPRPCTGARCPGSRTSRPPRQHDPTTHGRPAQIVAGQHHAHPGSPAAAAAAAAARVLPAGCADAECAPAVKRSQPSNDTRDCRGIECRLPQKIRPRVRARSCAGDGCSSEESASQLPPVHLSDRAAQFLGDFPELGYPSSELGGAPLGVQLTCDIKPGLITLSFPSSFQMIMLYEALRVTSFERT